MGLDSMKGAYIGDSQMQYYVCEGALMNLRNGDWRILLSKDLALASIAVLAVPLFGQGQNQNKPRSPLPEDWSSQHVVFSPPTSPQAAAAAQKDPRYLQQLLR